MDEDEVPAPPPQHIINQILTDQEAMRDRIAALEVEVHELMFAYRLTGPIGLVGAIALGYLLWGRFF